MLDVFVGHHHVWRLLVQMDGVDIYAARFDQSRSPYRCIKAQARLNQLQGSILKSLNLPFLRERIQAKQ